MALYLGSTPVSMVIPNTRPWWSYGTNPKFLYEANYQCTLADTDYSTLTPSTSAQSLKFPATTYTASANTNVVFDRYGSGYHNGEALDFLQYDYYVLADYLIHVAYTGTESTMGATHTVKDTYTAIIYPYRNFTVSNSVVTNGISTNNTITIGYTGIGRLWYRNASNAIVAYGSQAYGFYFTPSVFTLSASNRTVPINYLNFRTPTLSMRANNTYHILASFNSVDATNTIIKIRQRLYRTDKADNCWETLINRQADIYNANDTFPTELI